MKPSLMKIWNGTYQLLTIWNNVIRLTHMQHSLAFDEEKMWCDFLSLKHLMSLTIFWSWETLLQVFHKSAQFTHSLLVIGTPVMRLHFEKKVQYHSLPVGHGKSCPETTFQNNLQHYLHPVCYHKRYVWQGCLSEKCEMSPTNCWQKENMYEYHTLADSQMKGVLRLHFTQTCNVITHCLSVTWGNATTSQKYPISLTTCYWSYERCDQAALHKKCAVLLTFCWSWKDM